MKTCGDCVHYTECLANYNTYHVSTLTPDSDVTDRCKSFEDKTKVDKPIVYCKDCKYYSVDSTRLGNICTRLCTVFPMNEYDFCSYGKQK